MAFSIEEKFIRIAESELDVKLPKSFIEKLGSENGGELETEEDVWTFFPVFDSSDRKRISRTANHIVKENKTAKGWDDFPHTGLTIADNGSGDYLVYLIDENVQVKDEIYIWFHETGKLEKIANSLKELLDK